MEGLKAKSGEFRMEAPSNIALVKYWGKKGYQLPQNPSVSLTLSHCKTIMDVEYDYSPGNTENFVLDFYFESKKKEDFEDKILTKIVRLTDQLSFLKDLKLKINALNTFPHSSGIASSASSMACLAQVFAKIYYEVSAEKMTLPEVSSLARCFSGSASRSLFGGYSYWGKHSGFHESSDEYAVALDWDKISPEFKKLKNTIIVIDQGSKKVATTNGHSLMEDHPYATTRYTVARDNFKKVMAALESGDWSTFKDIVRKEAYELHAMMMLGGSPYSLLKGNSITVMEEIDKLMGENKKLKLTYTLDAGPNIHLIYHEDHSEEVSNFLEVLEDKGLFQFVISDSILQKVEHDFVK